VHATAARSRDRSPGRPLRGPAALILRALAALRAARMRANAMTRVPRPDPGLTLRENEAPFSGEDYLAGRMFWFMRNRLSGS
jgi:hypothetical protein